MRNQVNGCTPSLWQRVFVFAVILLAAIGGVLYWGLLGLPIHLPDAPSSKIACVSYAPFRRVGEDPANPHAFVSSQRIDDDLKRLSGRFDCVRTYSQAMGLSAVPRLAKRYGMKVLLGIWLSSDKAANAHEVAQGIQTARAYPKTVRAIVVGNEVLMRGELSPHQLVGYIREVRAATTVPVTYADGWTLWLQYTHNDELANAVSFVTVHILPYWDKNPPSADQAVAYVNRIYHDMERALPNKPILIGETGWPSEGKAREDAVPSRINEASYVRRFLIYANKHAVRYNLIESFDQPWKRGLEGTVGGYWGLFGANAKPKFALQGPVVEVKNWWFGWLASFAVGMLFATFCGTGARRRLIGVLGGIGTGSVLAEAMRSMSYSLQGPWLWLLGLTMCALAGLVAFACTRLLAAWLVDENSASAAFWAMFVSPFMHGLWLLSLAYIDLLLVFDGRYRDYPVAVFAAPAVAFALCTAVTGAITAYNIIETRILAAWVLIAATGLFAYNHAANKEVLGWLACNLLLAAPVILSALVQNNLIARQSQHPY